MPTAHPGRSPRREPLRPAALAPLALLLALAPARGQDADPSWIGKRVFPATADTTFKVGKKVVYVAKKGVSSFRVEKVRGPWLWVTSPQVSAWVKPAEVIPFDRAIDHFTAQIQADPANAAFYYGWRGLVWHDKKDYDNAIADYTEAIRLDPRNPCTYTDRGICWNAKDDYRNAIADSNEAIRLDPTYGAPHVTRADAHWSLKDYDKALADYSEAIRKDPSYALAYLDRGLLWKDIKKDPGRALADFDDALRIVPTYADAYMARGDLRSAQKDYDKAIADYDQAIRYDPESSGAYASRGEARRVKKDYDRALDDLGKAIRLNPKYAYAYAVRGNVLQGKGDHDRAVADYREATRLDPKYTFAHNQLAWHWATCPEARCRDGKKAVESATKACELTEWKDANTLDTLAAACAEAGDFDAAVKWQEKALGLLAEDAKTRGGFEARLKLYRDKTPYREELKRPAGPPTAEATVR